MFQDDKHCEIVASIGKDVYINCAVCLPEEDIYIFGADQGLYSFHNKTLTPISGPLEVFNISTIEKINVALMIADADRVLISCDLSHLNNLAMCAPCTKPTLVFQKINVKNLAGFHILQVSDFTRQRKICVATCKQLVIMGYEEEMAEFIPLRILDTAEPTSCILFTELTVIVGANKFFEIDLNTFMAEEFLDCSDIRLKQVTMCYKMGSFPLAVMQISKDPIEYLVCFSESAFFVDAFGHCSRVTDLKWIRVPRAFCFIKPYLYVFQFNGIEVIKITTDTCNLQKNSVESLLNLEGFQLEFECPRYLGQDRNGVLVMTKDEVRRVDARKSNGDDSSKLSESLENDDGESDKFSFTSSIEHYLNASISDAGSDICEGGVKQKIVKFNTDL